MNKANPLRNLFSIVFGRTSELILTFFSITILVRYLGATNYGIFASSVAFLSIISKTVDFGFSQIIFREFSANSKYKSVINAALNIRLISIVVLAVLYNIFAYLISMQSEEIVITNILFANIIFSAKLRNIRDLIEIPFKSILKMDIVMFATFIDSLFLLLFIISATLLNFNLIEITICYTVSNLPGFLILIYYSRSFEQFKYKFELNNLKWLFKESFPLWGAGILSIIFLQADVFLLKVFSSPTDAGYYSAALRIGVPLSIFSLSIITTIFPIIIKYRKTDLEQSNFIANFSYKILLLLLFIPSVIVTFKSSDIISLLYGSEFEPASLSLIILYWSFLFYYLGILSQNLITIVNKQKHNFFYSLILVTILLPMLYFTLQVYGPNGTAASRLVASFVGFIYVAFILIKSGFAITFMNIKLLTSLVVIFLSALIIYKLDIFLFIPVLITIIIFQIYILKFFNKKELELFYKILKEPKWLKPLLKT